MSRVALRAAALVAAVYGTFLIFAQFAFVELLREQGAGLAAERTALGLMAVAGILGGFWIARRGAEPAAIRRALLVSAASAAVAPVAGGWPAWLAVALATGGALGVATVALSALLRGWCGVAWVGVGTGLGYACCNLPCVFSQAPQVQAWIGAGFALAGACLVPSAATWHASSETPVSLRPSAAVALFAALVWLDSAAFFIIQHEAEIKAGTWGASMHWRNSLLHLAAALGAGWWLARGGIRSVPVLAWALLAVAGLAANDRGTLTLAGWLYPVGVSLYSTALVAWPAWFGGAAEPRAAARRAAWLFAIAGWLASANGIGMAETLRRVPVGFVLAAGAVVLGAAWFSGTGKWRAALGAAVILAAVGIGNRFRHNPTALSPAERGRQVYLAEGCIHCHSQFIRPGTLDEQLWGMAASTRDVLATTPVLIGNRRQGPDLANAGARRSAAWLREHFINPQLLIPGSAMPAYPHLFNDHRGADLIAYLQTIGNRVPGPNLTVSSNWRPQTAERPDPAAGGRLFARWCAVCHGDSGRGDGKLARRFVKPPANLADGPLLWTAATEQRELKVARIIKFGIPGTDMPGHEVLTDTQISDLTAYVLRLHDKRSVLAW